MNIHHIAIWVRHLEIMKDFYAKHFQAKPGPLYKNPKKSFKSYFLYFPNSQVKLELMHNPNIPMNQNDMFQQLLGVMHYAIFVGDTKEELDAVVEQMEEDDVVIMSPPRITGAGFYEAVILDPEGNRVELTCGKIFPPKEER